MGAKSASRAQQHLTRSGSFSTRLSARGHGFEFAHWEDEGGVPVVLPNGESPPESADDLTVAQVAAAAYRDDVRWLKHAMHGVRRLIRLGQVQDAQMLANIVLSLPNKVHPARQRELIEARTSAETTQLATYYGWVPSPEFREVLQKVIRMEHVDNVGSTR